MPEKYNQTDIIMTNLYKESWRLYKAQSETFTQDQEYYYNFCKNHTTLDLFAGYGRLTNYLALRNIDIEAVELEKEFANFIKIDKSKIHINDVLKFSHKRQFERIIAGWNSFCLFTKVEQIKQFFSKIESFLVPDGYASLSYFDTNYWKYSLPEEFYIDKTKIFYEPAYDLSKADSGCAIWIDKYQYLNGNKLEKKRFEYPVRVYKSSEALLDFYKHTSLELINVVENFGLKKEEMTEAGWVDYVFRKRK